MFDPLLIFIAGPYSNPDALQRELNVSTVHDIVRSLMKKGHYVLECHSLEHAFHKNDELSHADFLRQTLYWLTRCDAIYIVAQSPGANLELQKAQEIGLKVYWSLDEVPDCQDYKADLEKINQALHP